MIVIETRARGLDKYLRNLSDAPAEIKEAIVEHLNWAAPMLHGEVVRLASGPVLHRRTGRYASAVRHEVSENTLTARVGTKLIYARQKELGGTVKPKRSKIGIAVPTKFALTKAGASKKPRDYPASFLVRRRKDGMWILFGKRTAKSRQGVKPLFTFHRRVTQDAHPVFETAFVNERSKIERNAARCVEVAVIKAFPER